MKTEIDMLFDDLLAAAEESTSKNDKWIVIDKACACASKWTLHDYQEVLDRILWLVEQFPHLDFGGPGPFGSFIETRPVGAYSRQLVDSLQRVPCTQVLGWLDRTMRMDASERRADGGLEPDAFAEVLKGILENSRASEDCKAFATACFESLQ